MIKGKVSRVVFSSGIAPSESEYFDEINSYSKKNWWLILLFLSRTMIPLTSGVQLTFHHMLSDFHGACFLPALESNFKLYNWSYQDYEYITSRTNHNKKLENCHYFNYNYTIFQNRSIVTAKKIKENLRQPDEAICTKEKIILSPLTDKNTLTEIYSFCSADQLARNMEIIRYSAQILGLLAFGILADIFGRRLISLVAVGIWSFSSWCLTQNLSSFGIIFYFLSSFGSTATDLITYINLIEISHKKIRFFAVLTLNGDLCGFLLFTWLATKISLNWANEQYIAFCFTLCAVFTCWYMPESPRWLINKTKYTQALEVMKEIIGYIPNEILFEGFGPKTVTWTDILNMLRFLRKRKLKILCILGVIRIVSAFIIQSQAMEIIHDIPYRLKIMVVNTSVQLLGAFYALIIYAALGKKLGLFWTFIFLNFLAFCTICLRDESINEKYFIVLVIINGSAAKTILASYIPDLFPAFLRCTGLCIITSLGLFMVLIVTIILESRSFDKITMYILILLSTFSGYLILKLPDTTHSNLSSVKLSRV